ncbi:MAG TPA: ATP-binding protein [Polyangia bacterium]|nr:ATP-binding protein [Polyangia bacterium]
MRTLLVEDSADDAELMLHQLAEEGYEPHWQRVETPEAFRAALEAERWDVILADFSLPRFGALAALELLKASGRDIPFIIVSGSLKEEHAVEAMKAGAHDFFAKHNLSRLASAIAREVREATIRRERNDAFLQLRQAEERYRLIVENVKDAAICLLDAEGGMASWSGGGERITGYRPDEVLGRPYALFFTEEDRSAGLPEETLRTARAQGSSVDEGWRVRKDGSHFWAECMIDAIRSGDALVGYSCICRDISEKKRLVDDLQQAVRARDEFLSIASHELKTPLTSLQLQVDGYRHLVEQHPELPATTARLAKKMATIARQTERLQVLIEHLLDVTRVTSGRLVLEPDRVDLTDIVRRVLILFEDRIERAGVTVELRPFVSVVGHWDRLRLEEVVGSLLGNAIKYGAHRPVEISVGPAEDRARLVVTDHGIGMSPEERDRIFQRFERAVPETHYGGFGLGLWMVRQVVEAHRGSIEVFSEKGRGSTFIVELPITKVTMTGATDPEENGAR